MDVSQKSVLITGAARGIGRALVAEALRRGARRVYAGTRGTIAVEDTRVVPVALDVTSTPQIAAAASAIGELDLLVNNAGVASYGDLADLDAVEGHLAVNLLGALNVSRAFLPQLRRTHGAIINQLSLAGIAAVPVMPSYSISKAAALNLTQAMRALLVAEGVRVHGVILGPIDNDMTRGLTLPKTAPQVAAAGIFDGLENGDEDIFPDAASRAVADQWRSGVSKTLEAQFMAFVPQAEPRIA